MVKPETAGVYEGAEVYEGAVDYEGAEVYEDEPGTDLREAECAADSLEELRAARAAAGQSAGKRGLRSRAEGHAVCARAGVPTDRQPPGRCASGRVKTGIRVNVID